MRFSLRLNIWKVMTHTLFDREQVLLERNDQHAMTELCRQVVESPQSQDEPLLNMNMLEAIFSCMPVGVSIQDPDYRILYQNPMSHRLFGESAGRYCFEAYERRSTVCEDCPVAMSFEDGGIHRTERKVQFSSGLRYFEITASPLCDLEGAIIGAVEVVCEVTEHRRQEDEIRNLNIELEARVAERTRQLSEANQILREEIRQRTAAQEEVIWLNEDLIQRTQALESANREMEAFSYSVSHDLRAPLRHIEGFSRLLMEECADHIEDHGRDYLNRVCRASNRMSMLIDDLLGLSKVSRSDMLCRQVNLTQVAREVCDELQESNPARDVDFRIAEDVIAWGDPRLLRAMLVNLFGNAWKYTGKKDTATIEFGCIEQEAGKVFFVKDDGVGFDMNYADRLFGTFQRLHHANDFEGSGIGLATVQRIINRHQGKIWADSEIGFGATFYFTLPEQNFTELSEV